MEGDLATVIGWMKSGDLGTWRLAQCIKELASALNSSFQWIPRKANSSADDLAKSVVHRISLYMDSLRLVTLFFLSFFGSCASFPIFLSLY